LPLLSLLRAIFAILSLLLLAAAVYLLWSWYQGELVRGEGGLIVRVRDDWRFWTGGTLLAWSFLGKFVVGALLAKGDREPMRLERGRGEMVESSTGAILHVETFGRADAQPIILTHGWSLDSRIWFYAKHELAKRYRVVVWDLPGLGLSKRPSGGKISLTGFAEDLAAVLSHIGGREALLVGHSIGGMIIQTLARVRPALFGREIAGIVLLNTTYTNPLKTMVLSGPAQTLRWPVIEPMMHLKIWLQPLAWVSAWQSYLSGSAHIATRLGFGRFVTRSQLDRTTLLMTVNSPAVSARGDLAMFRWHSAVALAHVDVPVLILAGSKDIVTKPGASRSMKGAVPRAELVVIEGVNHMGPVERADLYNSAIVKFAEALAPPTRGTPRGPGEIRGGAGLRAQDRPPVYRNRHDQQ
jgi:pimeloyl-ACP methyl ester carboxylesterase